MSGAGRNIFYSSDRWIRENPALCYNGSSDDRGLRGVFDLDTK
jgi:hypothetical protein